MRMMRALRLANASILTINNAGICEALIPNSVYAQCVRWKRKPIWLGTAKTKVFRIPKKPVIPTKDHEELKRLYNHYRTYMTSLRAHIKQIVNENQEEHNEAVVVQTEEENFQACNAINEEWNTEVAKIREARLAKEREAFKEKILQNLIKIEEKQEILRKQIDEEIRKAKMEAPTFITAENIDEAIEKCLMNVVNHNSAMDLKGNWYEGKYPVAPAPEKTNEPTAIQQ